jgi:ABC-type sugar transport system ATPase subunit
VADVVLEQVGKTYDSGIAELRDVSLRVEDCELHAVVGPSGSGKTTLLRMIAGLETPTRGNVRIGERIVNTMAPYHRNVAMVFQRPALYSHLSVYQNIGFGLKPRREGWRRLLVRCGRDDEIHYRIIEIAHQLGVEDVLERRPATLSGGQLQRVALGRALARRPSVYLLEELLSILDAPCDWKCDASCTCSIPAFGRQ